MERCRRKNRKLGITNQEAMKKGIIISLCILLIVCISIWIVANLSHRSKIKKNNTIVKPLDLDSVEKQHAKKMDSTAKAGQDKVQQWINLELLSLRKQYEFKGKMDISEARYQVNGKKQDYRAFYIYRDSLLKWIKFKDSLNKEKP